MKNTYSKISLVIALGVLSSTASATYPDCRAAGGGFWGCAWEAAMNDRIAPPTGDQGTNKPIPMYTQAQFKEVYSKKIGHCSQVAVEAQMSCLSKGLLAKPAEKVVKPAVKIESKPMTQIKKPAALKSKISGATKAKVQERTIKK